MKQKITVALTGLNAIDSPGSGVGVARAIRECKEFDVRLIGLSYESLEPGAYMHDVVDKSYQIPYPSAGSNRLMGRIEYIHDRENLDVVIPNFDAELPNFIKLTDEFRRWGLQTYLPTLKQLEEIDKIHLQEFANKGVFTVPKTKFISDRNQINDLKDDFDFPMVVKGKFYDAFVAYNEGQVNSYYDKLSAKWGLPVVIQEFVEGTEIDIAGLGDGEGNLIGAVPMRKLYITDKGKGWSGITLEDEALMEITDRFIKASKWKGGFELELMRTRNDELYVMEVNPRFPAWIYTTAAAGQNMPAALVKLALNMKVVPFETYEVGKMFVRYSWDMITDINEFEQLSTMGEL